MTFMAVQGLTTPSAVAETQIFGTTASSPQEDVSIFDNETTSTTEAVDSAETSQNEIAKEQDEETKELSWFEKLIENGASKKNELAKKIWNFIWSGLTSSAGGTLQSVIKKSSDKTE